ncbi:MAG: septation protein SpoVG family protein [Candidatus Omnitrophica bacterium]|nr:septation protein SpoVG family protein [Candidatus Omnitrophota bacterium]
MEITDIRIFLRDPSANAKLKGYATVTFDHCFVVRNLKVIEGTKGLFVAMPSERAKEPCPKCAFRNAVRSHYCNQCGGPLSPPAPKPAEQATGEGAAETPSEHRDIAHPITVECREYIQRKVLEAYETARQQGQPSP